MKELSSYNYFLNDNGRIIYFNGLTKAVFSLSPDEHSNVQKLFRDLPAFESGYPKEFKRFCIWGFIVDDKEDEINEILTKNRLDVYDKSKYTIIINPTLNCNFNCWYCFESHEDKGYMSSDTIERLKFHIRNLVIDQNIKSLNLSYFGGEPLLYFKKVVQPIDEYANSICKEHSVSLVSSFTTNGYLINSALIEQLKKSNFNYGFQITIDGGRERHNKIRNINGKPTFDVIIENINNLCASLDNVFVTIRVNYDDETLEDDDLKAVFQKINPLNRSKIHIDFQRVFQTKKVNIEGDEYQSLLEYLEYCKNAGFHVVYGYTINKDKFHKCYADLLSTTILNYDGKVYGCTARDFNEDNCIGELNAEGYINHKRKDLYCRLAKPTFDNEKCIHCKHLPICFGPCSQICKELITSGKDYVCDNLYQDIAFDTKIKAYYHKIQG